MLSILGTGEEICRMFDMLVAKGSSLLLASPHLLIVHAVCSLNLCSSESPVKYAFRLLFSYYRIRTTFHFD